MMASASSALRSQYEEQGYLSPIAIHDLSSPSHARIVAGFDALAKTERLRDGFIHDSNNTYLSLVDRHFDQRWLWEELAIAPAVLDVVEALIGPDIMLMASHIFVKFPLKAGTAASAIPFVDWHQDVRYWSLDDNSKVVTLWYAVDPSDNGNGCLQVLPRSHTGGLLAHGTSSGARGKNLLASNQAIEIDRSATDVVDFVLRPGQASVHHGMIVHGSRPNLSETRRRCGVTLRFFPPSVRQHAANNVGGSWKAVCVRGVDKFGHFGNTAFPTFGDTRRGAFGGGGSRL